MKKLSFSAFILLTLSLMLCGCAKQIEFAAGPVDSEIQELNIVLQDGETELLSSLPLLSSADFSGSSCYEEIFLWAENNPQVDVRYTITLPDGSVVDSDVSKLKLDKMNVHELEQAAALMDYLPELKVVDISGCDIYIEDYVMICSLQKDIGFTASFQLHGQNFDTSVSKLDMTGITAADAEQFCLLLPELKDLEFVELGNEESSPELSCSLVSAMQKACPNAEFAYSFTRFDKILSTADTTLDLSYIRMYDNGEAVMDALSCMPKLEYLDMDSCDVPNEDMAKIRDTYPNVKVVWRVWFGDNYCVRTDAEKILASMPSAGGELTPKNTEALKYCTEIKYIDVGHNNHLTDISFVSCMPKLEVAIFAMDFITDVSPLANCPELEFLEIQTSKLTDISPLSGLSKLKHLNICYLDGLTDISPIMDLDLDRLWIGDITPIPQEQIDEYQKLHPDCRISTENHDPHEGGWRYDKNEQGVWGMHPRYEILVKQFGYDSAAYSFPWKDPLYRWYR
ncbi:MAG: hypothetical protein IJ364_07180 [Oscillospiraceae bacterium]|nr:hypothetical protein [Oscillospiraceae bacterium]